MRLNREEIEEKYFRNGKWSIIKSEERRAELKKERRTAPKIYTTNWGSIYEKAVPLASSMWKNKVVKEIKEKCIIPYEKHN